MNIKSTGIVRSVDELGRIVIPKELRRTLGFSTGTPLDIYTEGGRMIFEKHKPDLEKEAVIEALENLDVGKVFDDMDLDAIKRAIALIK